MFTNTRIDLRSKIIGTEKDLEMMAQTTDLLLDTDGCRRRDSGLKLLRN